MASIIIKSDLPNFSYAIKKNPNSGMIAKLVRKGRLFGWYSLPNRYNCLFIEGKDEISYYDNKDKQQGVLNLGRYSHPLFITDTLKNFFSTAMNTDPDFDTFGMHEIEIYHVHIKRPMVIFNIANYLHDYCEVLLEPIKHFYKYETINMYKITIRSETTIKKLFSLTYLLSYIIAATNGSYLNITNDIALKLIKICNLLELLYYPRYLIKTLFIKNKDMFAKVKTELEYSDCHKIEISSLLNNQAERYSVIEQRLFNLPSGVSTIIDFGSGKGYYLKLLLNNNLHIDKYIAIDKDIDSINTLTDKATRLDLINKLTTFNSFADFYNTNNANSRFIFLMSEVFEHINLDTNTDILTKILLDFNNCYKLILTTPNKDFNINYPKISEFRHTDHKFEMTKQELTNYINYIANLTDRKYNIVDIGDKVDGISTTLLVEIY